MRAPRRLRYVVPRRAPRERRQIRSTRVRSRGSRAAARVRPEAILALQSTTPNFISSPSRCATASTESAILDFVGAHPDYDILCLIQATSPFIAPDDFIQGVELLQSTGADSLVTAVP